MDQALKVHDDLQGVNLVWVALIFLTPAGTRTRSTSSFSSCATRSLDGTCELSSDTRLTDGVFHRDLQKCRSSDD